MTGAADFKESDMKQPILAITAILLVLAACGDKEQPAPRVENQAAAAARQAAPAAPAARSKPAGPYVKKDTYFKLPGAAGGDIDLAAFAGQPVLVMFFTESCPYCRKAAPFMQRAYSAYSPKGLVVLGILIQERPQPAVNFAADLGVTFPLAYKGREVSRNYRAQGVPYIYLLTKEHEIYDVWEGYAEQYDNSILKAVETVLAKK